MRLCHNILSGLLLLLAIAPSIAQTDEWKVLLDLRGQWKFQAGDDMRWVNPTFDDRGWDSIFVPSPWEDEGYPGYDGYGWYRKHFTVSPKLKDASIYLHLGQVDDVSEVYLNGRLVGFAGSFPPDFRTAYEVYQRYPVPPELINFGGENIIAVRVYDVHLAGGIVNGKVGLFEPKDFLKPDIALPGIWKFRAGDDMAWKDAGFDDRSWQDMMVPAFWDGQGYRDYDGFGWYRVRFRVPQQLRDKDLVLLLGRIDDIDETYLNGERIGRTGRMRSGGRGQELNNEYLELRAYTIPVRLLREDENILAVRVYDGMFHGGIYDGPIGIVTTERYREWNKGKGVWRFFDFFR